MSVTRLMDPTVDIKDDNVNSFVDSIRESCNLIVESRKYRWHSSGGCEYLSNVRTWEIPPDYEIIDVYKACTNVVGVVMESLVTPDDASEVNLLIEALISDPGDVKGLIPIINNELNSPSDCDTLVVGADKEVHVAAICGITIGAKHPDSISKHSHRCEMGWDLEWLFIPGAIDGLETRITLGCVWCTCGLSLCVVNDATTDILPTEYTEQTKRTRSIMMPNESEDDGFLHEPNVVFVDSEALLADRIMRWIAGHMPVTANAHNSMGADAKQILRAYTLTDDMNLIMNSRITYETLTLKNRGKFERSINLKHPMIKFLDSYVFASRVAMKSKCSLKVLAESYNLPNKLGFHEFTRIRNVEMLTGIIEYCLRDSWLHMRLAQVMNITGSLNDMRAMSGCLEKDISTWSTANIAESYYATEALALGRRVMFKKVDYKPYRNLGGTVIFDGPGLYTNVVVLDFDSEYPSIYAQYGIGPDSITVHEVRDRPPIHKYMRRWKSGNRVYLDLCHSVISWEWIDHTKINPDDIRPDTNFSLIALLCAKLLRARKLVKADIAGLKKKVKTLRDRGAIRNTVRKILRLEARSMTLKNLANSMYGATASDMHNHTGKRCAEGITFTGRDQLMTIKKSAEEMGLRVVGGDTDSIFTQGCDWTIDEDGLKQVTEESISTLRLMYRSNCHLNYLPNLGMKAENYHGATCVDAMLMLAPKNYAIRVADKVYYKGLKPVRSESSMADKAIISFLCEITLTVYERVSETILYVGDAMLKSLRAGNFDVLSLCKRPTLDGIKTYRYHGLNGIVSTTSNDLNDIEIQRYSVKKYQALYNKMFETVLGAISKSELSSYRNKVSMSIRSLQSNYMDLTTLPSFEKFMHVTGIPMNYEGLTGNYQEVERKVPEYPHQVCDSSDDDVINYHSDSDDNLDCYYNDSSDHEFFYDDSSDSEF